MDVITGRCRSSVREPGKLVSYTASLGLLKSPALFDDGINGGAVLTNEQVKGVVGDALKDMTNLVHF